MATATAALKNDACFKSSQKWHKNNDLATLTKSLKHSVEVKKRFWQVKERDLNKSKEKIKT